METPSPMRRVSIIAKTEVSTSELYDQTAWTCGRVFEALDTDNSSFLDVGELVIGLSAVLGRKVSREDAEKIVKKADSNADGKLGFKEFERLCKSGKLGKSFTGYFGKKGTGRHKGTPSVEVLTSRQEILAHEMSKGGNKVSVTDLRLLKPVPASMVTSLTYALHFVETDFSCPGLYRYSKTKKTSKILKVVDLLERGQRVKVREFRDAVGQNGAVVASAVTQVLNDYAPIVPYALYDDVTACKDAVELKDLFARTVENGSFPQLYLDFLGSFCIHLFDLLKFSDRNMMGMGQLKQPLGHLVCRKNENGLGGDGGGDELDRNIKDGNTRGKVFALMVTNAEAIFGEREEFLWGQRARADPAQKATLWKNSTTLGDVNYSALALTTGKIKFGGKDRQAEVMMSKAEEMAVILKAGDASDPAATGGHWYVVESKFVFKWLAYVAMKEKMVEGVNERPYKINNTKLLGVQEQTKMLYWKEGMKCASARNPGDYRLVNYQTWKKFCNLYPGSGPAIYVEDDNKEDVYHFYIDQLRSPYALEREKTEANEFDEYTTGDPVFKRNRGENGAGFDFYRDSGIEDILRASGEFFGGVMSLFEGEGKEGGGEAGGYVQMTSSRGEEKDEKEKRELEKLLEESDTISAVEPKTPPKTKKVTIDEVPSELQTPAAEEVGEQ